METKIARCGRAIKDKTIGYKNRNSANKVSMSRSQNTFARIEREALKNARHRSTIPDIVIIVKIIFVLRLILEAKYELIQKVVRLHAAFRSLVFPDPVTCLLTVRLHVYS